jgi:ectoine hydroxylase-related dioxygenase (phytanoyl-CoA dioxygenase family)
MARSPATARTLTTADADRHAAEIAERGYTILEDALDRNLVSALLEDLERLHTALDVKPAENGFEGTATLRVYNLLVHGEHWQGVPLHDNVLPVVERVLDPGCLVSSLSSITILPGETAQPIHADDQLIPIPKPHPPTVCNTMWALTDFTDANGATRLVPESHLGTENPVYGADYDTIPAEMATGSVLVWHGSLWHGGGANQTDERRVGIAMNYCAGYIRQQENQQLGIPAAIARTFPKRLQQLVGYSVYNGLIGHIDKHDPRKLILEDAAAAAGMIWDAG